MGLAVPHLALIGIYLYILLVQHLHDLSLRKLYMKLCALLVFLNYDAKVIVFASGHVHCITERGMTDLQL